jgi:hypothetical protein
MKYVRSEVIQVAVEYGEEKHNSAIKEELA